MMRMLQKRYDVGARGKRPAAAESEDETVAGKDEEAEQAGFEW